MSIPGNRSEIIIPVDLTDSVSIDHNVRSTGKHSRVYQGRYKGEVVALKVITLTGTNAKREVETWASTNHHNIHPILGVATAGTFGLSGSVVISPWVEKGNSSRYLSENGQRLLVADRIRLWRGVLDGVVYLHSQSTPIIHGDLKPSNILIDDSGMPKICDFGLGRVFSDHARSEALADAAHRSPSTLETDDNARYMAPEQLFGNKTVYSAASDVYALGCLGLVFIYRQKPYAECRTTASILRAVNNAKPPAMEPVVHDWPTIIVWPSILKCWCLDPVNRPEASALIRTLDHTATLTEPKNLTGQITSHPGGPAFRGVFSFVYRGGYAKEMVAIKVLSWQGRQRDDAQAMAMKRKVNREMTIWANTTHPNILPFYGYANDQAFEPFGALISPWCSNGDATAFMETHGRQMPLCDRIQLWKGVMDGIVYLHTREPPIIHGDLKPGNVVINDAKVPMICDFGLARIVLELGSTGMTTSTEHGGTERYLAPELISDKEHVCPTVSSDVYALGLIGLEFLYLEQPYKHRKNNRRNNIFNDIKQGVPPAVEQEVSHHCNVPKIWALLVDCWKHEPTHRPTSSSAVSILEACVADGFPA